MTNQLDDAGVVAFLMKNLRREKSGDSLASQHAVSPPAIGAVVDEVPLTNTLPMLAMQVANQPMSMQVTALVGPIGVHAISVP